MAVRSALPWPFRWAILAIAFGFCAAIGLWAFEFGKEIAGLDRGSKAEVTRLNSELAEARAELEKMREERDKAQSIANTAGTLVTTERAAHEGLSAQMKQLELENRSLRDDLGFFEKLIPVTGVEGVVIRGLQAELQNSKSLKWQILVIQASRNAPEFVGRLEVSFAGVFNGRAWSGAIPGVFQMFTIKQYGRMEGVFDIPDQVQIKSVTARILDGNVVRATQSVKL